MRHILVAALLIGNLLLLSAVKAHGTNYQDTPALQQLGEKAVITIKKKRPASLKGYLLVVCKASGWKSLAKDSDLGPFLRYKKAAANLDAIVAMPPEPTDDSTYGIYFEDNKPIGLVEIMTGKGEKVTDANVAKAYVSVTEDSDQRPAGQIRFEVGQAFSDDDQPIPTLQVVSEGPAGKTDPQEDFRSGAIKSSSGYLLVWNQPNNYYVLEIKGKEVRQTSTERKLFSVDGMFLQIVDAPVKDFVQVASGQKLDDKAILEAHRDWETKFLEDAFKEKLKIESSSHKLTNGKEVLLWYAGVPESAKSNVRKQAYLTIVKGDYVLLLGGAVTDTIGESATQQLLLNTVETLKTSDKPTDLEKVREAIKKESAGKNQNHD